MRSTKLNRRFVLRGIGAGAAMVTIPLPRLGAMLDGNGTAYADGTLLPKRFGIWFFGDGVILSRFVPAATGQGNAWQLSEQLAPLANVKSHLTVVSGMAVPATNGGHDQGTGGMLTGSYEDDPTRTDGHGYVLGPSLDQIIAKETPGFGDTPFPYIAAGCDTETGNFGLVMDFVSTAGRNAGIAPIASPKELFEKLFGSGAPPTPAGNGKPFAARKSVLDLVLADANRLRLRVGTEDKARLDIHLAGIRALEKRIDTLGKGLASCGIPADKAERYRMIGKATITGMKEMSGYYPLGEVPEDVHVAMSELLAYALACDRTRVFTYMFTPGAAHVYYRQLGLTQSFHEITHEEKPDENDVKTNLGVTFVMKNLAMTLEIMKAQLDGAGRSLLDSCCILVSTDVASGYTHSTHDHPILIAGKANGALRGDLHHRFDNLESTSKLGFTLAKVMGANITSFGIGAMQATSGIGDVLA